MALTLEQLEHIARLSRLELDPSEREHYRKQLAAVLEWAERVTGIDESLHPEQLTSHEGLRPDNPKDSTLADDLLTNSPDTERGFYRVPRVLDQ
ncbi:MAG: Asp-tRNA(Asn)/Glu-tRNA(Gln) amidotransferase subunit GatC [Chloroflexota bacterium]